MSLPKIYHSRINLRLEKTTFTKLQAAAKKRGVTISEYLREVLAGIAKAS